MASWVGKVGGAESLSIFSDRYCKFLTMETLKISILPLSAPKNVDFQTKIISAVKIYSRK